MQRLNLSEENIPTIDAPTFQRKLLKRFLLETIGIIVASIGFVLLPWLVIGFPLMLWYFAASISTLLFLRIITWSKRVQRLGRRYTAINASEQIKKDKRKPILYLRSFLAQYSNNDARSDLITDEEILTLVFKDLGPVVAIGLPQDKLPPLGAYRTYFTDNDWQKGVENLMKESQLIIIEPGYGQGLNWEIETARRICPPEKLMFSLLPFSLPDTANHNQDFEKFREQLQKTLQVKFPETDMNAMFLYFDSDWSPKYANPKDGKTNLYSFFADFRIDVTLVKVRETIRPVLQRRGLLFGKFSNIKDLTASVLRSMVIGLFLLYLLTVIFFVLFISQACGGVNKTNQYIQNNLPCTLIPK